MAEDHLTQPEELLERIARAYQTYGEALRREAAEKRMGDWLQGIFISRGASAHDNAFLAELEEALGQLGQSLGRLEADQAQPLAARAVTLVMAARPRECTQPAHWNLMVAEYFLEPLYPHLSRGDLAALRDAFARGAPRRTMFPRQRELLDKMDRLLAQG